jgi:excinuclease ABC subunit C
MAFDLNRLESLPVQPGVYLMKNKAGDVLYVGKAKNLRSRIRQYFLPAGDGRVMVPLLIAQVDSIETILVLSEKEALLLENNLIKEYKPKYNALLKDDKSYIALKINHKNKWPQVNLVRYKGKPEPDGLYFGPYTSAQAARGTLDLLNRIFPLRQCSDQELVRRTRPCILYDMKRCIAPCVNKCTKEEYDQLVERTIKFLKGQDKEVIKELYEEMDAASNALEFERAGMILKTIQQIEKTVESQSVDKPLGADADALGIYRQGEEVILSKLQIRSGKLMNSFHFNFSNIAQDDAELLESFLIQHYEKLELIPHEILLPVALENGEELSDILSTNKPRKVVIYAPQRGDKKNLIAMALVNAEAIFKEKKDKAAIAEKTLLEMQEKFRLVRYPKKIECLDNSNLSGDEPVSCLVAFTNGEKDRSGYRKFKVKTVEGPDDYATFYEVLLRRYKRAKEENSLPDLLIVDGGKGHLNIALKALAELDIITVDVISIAKESSRHDKGMTAEQIFLPNIKDPILLRHTSPILFLLQRIRDEAHRFAITFHRKRRSKKTIRTELIDIPGIGPVKCKILLKHFGSVKKLKEAATEDLQQIKGLSERDRQAIHKYFADKSEI